MEFDVYLFNWTNPNKLTKADFEKPILQQLGPYRFREIHEKTDVIWHHENNTVSYRRKGTFFFVESESVGRLDDIVITVNTFALVSGNTNCSFDFFTAIFFICIYEFI